MLIFLTVVEKEGWITRPELFDNLFTHLDNISLFYGVFVHERYKMPISRRFYTYKIYLFVYYHHLVDGISLWIPHFNI